MLGRTIAGMKVRIATPKYVKAIGEKPMEGASVPMSRMLRALLLDVGSGALGADLSNSGKIELDSRSVPLRESNERKTHYVRKCDLITLCANREPVSRANFRKRPDNMKGL
jgi:hypothetical protein